MTTPQTRADLVKGGEQGTALPNPWATGSWALFDSADLPARPQTHQLEQALRSDGRTALLEQALTLPLRGAAYTLQPPKGDSGQTEWVTTQLLTPANAGGMSTPLDLVVAQMTVATWQRTACFEKVWRPVDGGTRVGYDKLALRPGATVLRDNRTGAFQGITQQVPKVVQGRVEGTERITLPPARSFVYVHGSHRDPLYGIGDLDVSWLIADTKRKIRFLWWKFLENVSFPSGRMKTDHPAGSQELIDAGRRAASLRGGGILPLATGEDLLPYDSNGQGAEQFQAALDWLSSEQAQSVLAGFADLTGPGKVGGSYALSVSATDLFTAGRDSVLREMAASLTSYVVADLVRWNFGAGTPCPVVRFAPLRQTDLTETTTLLQALAGQANSAVPRAFIEELSVKVAGYLELDVDKVRAALDPGTPGPVPPAADGAPQPVATAATAVERARQLVLAADAVRAA